MQDTENPPRPVKGGVTQNGIVIKGKLKNKIDNALEINLFKKIEKKDKKVQLKILNQLKKSIENKLNKLETSKNNNSNKILLKKEILIYIKNAITNKILVIREGGRTVGAGQIQDIIK